MHTSASSRAAGQSDAVRVAAEHHDVVLDPVEGEGLVLQAVVAWNYGVAGAEEPWGSRGCVRE